VTDERDSSVTPFPIVDCMVQLPIAGRQTDELGRLNIISCPHTEWVLKLGSARTEARQRLKAVDRTMLRHLPGLGRLGESLADAVRRLTIALREVKQLLTRRMLPLITYYEIGGRRRRASGELLAAGRSGCRAGLSRPFRPFPIPRWPLRPNHSAGPASGHARGDRRP
jgi:hypothetical protein